MSVKPKITIKPYPRPPSPPTVRYNHDKEDRLLEMRIQKVVNGILEETITEFDPPLTARELELPARDLLILYKERGKTPS